MIRRLALPALIAAALLGGAGCNNENPPAGSLSIPRNAGDPGEAAFPEPAAEDAAPGAPDEGISAPTGGRVGLD